MGRVLDRAAWDGRSINDGGDCHDADDVRHVTPPGRRCLVGRAGLEPAASPPQTERATNCATARSVSHRTTSGRAEQRRFAASRAGASASMRGRATGVRTYAVLWFRAREERPPAPLPPFPSLKVGLRGCSGLLSPEGSSTLRCRGPVGSRVVSLVGEPTMGLRTSQLATQD